MACKESYLPWARQLYRLSLNDFIDYFVEGLARVKIGKSKEVVRLKTRTLKHILKDTKRCIKITYGVL